MTPIRTLRSQRFGFRTLRHAAGLPATPRQQAETLLRDVAYVLHLTQRVKAGLTPPR